MKILIINPPAGEEEFVREGRCEQRLSSYQYVLLPVSLPSIAALLREKGCGVKIIDCIAEKIDLGELKKEILRYKPGLIILNTSTLTYDIDMKVAKAIKETSKVPIAVIGVHVTSLPDEALSNPGVDFVIRGEPEYTSLDLAKTLENKKSLKEVQGVSYKNAGKIIHNPDRPYIEDLNNLPFPARDLVKNEKYLMSMSTEPHTVLLSSRGCVQNCIFCTARQYYGQKVRERSAENVAREMEEIVKKHGIKYITMWSDTFTFNKKFVLDLAKEIEKRKLAIKWMCNSRVDTIDEEMLKAMKKSGCIGIAYGVESGVQEILNNVKKGTRLSQIQEAFKLTNKVGIESLAHVIFGLPGETKKTIKQTIEFVKNLDPDYAQFYCAVPFPGTPFHAIAKEKGWITTHDWRKYEINQAIIETPQLSREELEKARREAYRSFYLRPSYIFKQLIKIRSFKDLVYKTKHALNFLKDWGGIQ